MSFNDKVAIVTGGSQGIGRAYVSALLRIGMKVCICDVKKEIAEEFIASLSDSERKNVIFQKCDVTSAEDFRGAFEKVISEFGGIDVLINNAGISDEQNWKKMIDVNFIGVVHGTKLGFEYMGKDKGGNGGQIINAASRAALNAQHGFPFPVYVATKHAVLGLTRSYGMECYFKKTGVAVKAICPTRVETELVWTRRSEVEEFQGLLGEVTRMLKPEEMAQPLVQLLEDGKNGAVLLVETEFVSYVE